MARDYEHDPGHDESTDPTTRQLFGAKPDLLPEVDLGPSVGAAPFRYMDGETSTAHAIARAIHMRLHYLGIPVDYPDMATYAVEGNPERALRALVEQWPDEDARRKQVEAHHKEGLEARRARLAKLAEEPPDTRQFRVVGMHRIVGVGGDAVVDAKAALSAGYPVLVGTPVDAAFEAYDGSKDLTTPESSGQHTMVLLTGYDRKNRMRGMGWWKGWGEKDRGPLFWAGSEWLASNHLDKLVVVVEGIRTAHPYAR